MKELEKAKKPVILTGDLNCVHEEINIFNPAGNKRSAGFTIEERQSFEMNFLSKGFVDTFRNQHPGGVGYIYWGYRHNGRKTNKVKQDGAWITSSSQSPSPIRFMTRIFSQMSGVVIIVLLVLFLLFRLGRIIYYLISWLII